MDRFALDLDETFSVGFDLDEDFSNHLDVAPFRNQHGQALRPEHACQPWWDAALREPGNLFDRLPRRDRAA